MLPLLGALCLLTAQEPTQSQLEQELNAYRLLLLDWASLARYGSDNSETKPPAKGETRVVFLGDEITENWPASQFFPGKPYFNRGITRQTSPQMLVRFRQDVLSLKPKVVVIQAGSNDVASVAGPMTASTIVEFYESMIDLAKAHDIRVVIASTTPVCDCSTKEKILMRRPVNKLLNLNEALEALADRTGSAYLDWYTPLAEGRNIKREYTTDGFLLTEAAYKLMGPLAEQAILEALSK